MICPYCGKDIPSGASFCGNCGSPIQAGSMGSADSAENGHSDAYNYFEGSSQQGMNQGMTGDGYQTNYQQSGYQQNGYQQNGYQQNGYQQNGSYQNPGGYNYQPNGYSTPPAPRGIATNRSIPICIVLTLVTVGIYGLYWFVVMTDEMNQAAGEPEATSGGMALLFSIITCGIYSIYWAYKMGEKVDRVKGQPGGNSPILFLILSIFGLGIINYCLIQDTLNKYA